MKTKLLSLSLLQEKPGSALHLAVSSLTCASAQEGWGLCRTHGLSAHTYLYSFNGGFQSQLLHSSPSLGYVVAACCLAGHLGRLVFPEI